MRPYIVINGISSRQVEGLLIQSLPPIAKPKMRISAEEIDGKDGDVVTVLGYAAYDKALTIGLKGDFNVDDVISFFETSGKIIFSSEPDKYYNFSMYNGIDFNRLIRFRTATVNLHVQPFKYSAVEPVVTVNNSENVITIPIRNTGNTISRPSFKITGSGSIGLYINNVQILGLSLQTNQTVIIDDMNVKDPEGNFLNRQVVGNYDKLTLQSGINSIKVTGNATEIEIDKYSRWV